MQRYIDIVRDETGAAIEAAEVRVYVGDTMTLATLYDGADTPVSQPLTTNASGVIVNAALDPDDQLGFKAAAGRYRIEVTKGAASFTLPGVELGALDTAEAADPGGTAAAAVADHEAAADPHTQYVLNTEAQVGAHTSALDASAVANTLTATLSPAPSAYAQWMRATVEVANTTTGAATLNLNSLGAKSIKLLDGTDPYSGAMRAGGVYEFVYDGTNFLLLSPSLSAATQADQETGSATEKFVTPGIQHYHPSAAKAWVNFNGTGTVAIRDSYNISSITDNGTGDYTVNFSTAMSSANYCPVIGARANSVFGVLDSTQSTASFRLDTRNSTFAVFDPSEVRVAVFGDM